MQFNTMGSKPGCYTLSLLNDFLNSWDPFPYKTQGKSFLIHYFFVLLWDPFLANESHEHVVDPSDEVEFDQVDGLFNDVYLMHQEL